MRKSFMLFLALTAVGTASLFAASSGKDNNAGLDAATQLSKKTQDPTSGLAIVLMRDDWTTNNGPQKNLDSNMASVMPIVPIPIPQANLMIITKLYVPVFAGVPSFSFDPSTFSMKGPKYSGGLGDSDLSILFSPHKRYHGMIWGLGMTMQLPTATNDRYGNLLGSGQFAMGPSGVIGYMGKRFVGVIQVQQVNSFYTYSGWTDNVVNQMQIQIMANYNLSHGVALFATPLIMVDWTKDPDEAWTLPIGGGISAVLPTGSRLAFKVSFEGFYNALRPTGMGPFTFETVFAPIIMSPVIYKSMQAAIAKHKAAKAAEK